MVVVPRFPLTYQLRLFFSLLYTTRPAQYSSGTSSTYHTVHGTFPLVLKICQEMVLPILKLGNCLKETMVCCVSLDQEKKNILMVYLLQVKQRINILVSNITKVYKTLEDLSILGHKYPSIFIMAAFQEFQLFILLPMQQFQGLFWGE